MKTLIVTQAEVPKLLPMKACADLMAETLRTLSRGDAVLPLRTAVWLPDRSGLLGVMPAYLGAPRCMGLKAVSVMPGNHGTEYDSHQGVVLLFDVEHGSLLAVIDGSSITAIRTAAVSAAATDLLALEDAHNLAILGDVVLREGLARGSVDAGPELIFRNAVAAGNVQGAYQGLRTFFHLQHDG